MDKCVNQQTHRTDDNCLTIFLFWHTSCPSKSNCDLKFIQNYKNLNSIHGIVGKFTIFKLKFYIQKPIFQNKSKSSLSPDMKTAFWLMQEEIN